MGRLAEAEQLGEEVVKRMTASDTLGKDHRVTLEAQAKLVTTYRRRGRLHEALTLGNETLQSQRRVLGNEHPDTLGSMASLGLAYHDIGRLAEARDVQDRALQARRRVLGADHPVTRENASELADTEYRLGTDFTLG